MINRIKHWILPLCLILGGAVLGVTGCRWFTGTLGTRLLYADSFMGRFYRFYYIPWILAGILLAAGWWKVRKLKREECETYSAVTAKVKEITEKKKEVRMIRTAAQEEKEQAVESAEAGEKEQAAAEAAAAAAEEPAVVREEKTGEPADTIICPKCGTVLKATAVFCKNCGTKIKTQEEK